MELNFLWLSLGPRAYRKIDYVMKVTSEGENLAVCLVKREVITKGKAILLSGKEKAVPTIKVTKITNSSGECSSISVEFCLSKT